MALAVAKPFVRSMTWLELGDSLPHVYPHAGLFGPNQEPKPVFSWLQSLRQDVIA